MTTTTPPPKSERIERLFLQGHSLDLIAEQGVSSGWSRAEAAQLAAARGWELDGSGRIPRHLRQTPPARPAGRQPTPAVAAARAGSDGRRLRTPGGPYVTALRAADLFVDYTYQRPLDQARVARMASSWEPRMLGVLDVSDRGPDARPRYAIVNGQHRCAAAIDRAGHDDLWVPCTVHEGLDPTAEAQLMYELDRGTKPLTSWDKWRARSAAGDIVVRSVEKVAADHGMKVEPTSFGAVGAAEQLVRRGGPALLAQTVATLVGAYGPTPAAVKAPMLTGIGGLLHANGDDVDLERLVAVLAKTSPQQLRAAADAFREVQGGTLAGCVTQLVAGLYNRTPGPRINTGHRA